MDSLIIVILAAIAIALVFPGGPNENKSRGTIGSVFFYITFIALGAFSPVVGFLIGGLFSGIDGFVAAFGFAWIGVAASLPMSLLAARCFGRASYDEYWDYMLSMSRFSKGGILTIWAITSVIFFLFGTIILVVAK